MFAALSSLAVASDASTSQDQPGYATFIQSTAHGNLTFSLSAVNSTGDTYIHLSGPTTYQWISVGTGSKMAGSVMLIVYRNESANGITLSTRLASGENQPDYSSQIDCKLLSGTVDKDAQSSTMKERSSSSSSSSSDFFSTNIHCTNLQSLGQHDGTLSFANQQQNFIYALGPSASSSNSLSSNSPLANLQQHSSTGKFWVDMVNATSVSSTSTNGSQVGVPSGAALLTAQNTGTGGGSDAMSAVHAAFMLLAFVIVFPLGAVLLRWTKNGVRAHWIVQSAGLVLTIVGGGLGIALSEQNDDQSSYSSAHQILGLIVFGLVFVQWALGMWHHLQYKRYQRPTVFAKIHRVVGPVILIIGFVNGFLGNNLSGDDDHNKWQGAVVGVVAVLIIGLLGWKELKRRKMEKRGEAFNMRPTIRRSDEADDSEDAKE
ncbi:hypothetical protein COCCADRAFT_26609 [Bipolaris zeicola 26-R-13]|uniref:Cytochrome b561 domain-containing protein n=1 Tax=Cochliobolus carbonum (strain 26-R-13) TaxID=930089 RepID=W6YBY8_COCC2|nr:uncharacterized protein COCCADRAFT_26609 [Bipolaris zeicola 26-R-13]EUC33034.1 hypothetical protein COCCADRAFT_26609 [Bipolaris zeicola 26-R-13]